MFKHLLKVAFRNAWKYKTFSLLNVAGLAIGMAGTFLLLMWVQHQLSIDQFHTKKDQLFKVFTNSQKGSDIETQPSMPGVLYNKLEADIPEITAVTRIKDEEKVLLYGDKKINARGNSVDPSFMSMFSFPLVTGDNKEALQQPGSILITQGLRDRLFGSDDPYNKIIGSDGQQFIVKGILKDLPANTQFAFDYLLPLQVMPANNAHEDRITAFVEVKNSTDIHQLNKKLKTIIQTTGPDQTHSSVFLYPLTKLGIDTRFENGKPSTGMINLVGMVKLIALIILLIACINFINLSTARSLKRAKEVGLRKVIGGNRFSLIRQFMAESILVAFIAGIIALGIVVLVLPSFNSLIQKNLAISFGSPYFYLSFVLFILVTGIIAGIYPAFFLSSFAPVKALKGIVDSNNRFLAPGRILFVIQFTIAVILINMTILIGREVDLLKHRELGFNKERLLFHPLTKDLDRQYPALKNELLASGFVQAISLSNVPITRSAAFDTSYRLTGKEASAENGFRVYRVTDDFVAANGLQLVAGRDIASNPVSDTNKCLVNESAVKMLGLSSPVGATLISGNAQVTIQGVVKDFLTGSPLQAVEPAILRSGGHYTIINLRTAKDITSAGQLDAITTIIKKYNSSFITELGFADLDFQERIKGLKVTDSLTSIFSFISIFIACLGLFGLLLFNSETRAKEISIRKVFGAGWMQISTLLSKKFVKLVLLSVCIGSPCAWLLMSAFLRPLYYRAELSWLILAEAGIFAILITFFTIGLQSIKAAVAKPVTSLRDN